MTESVSPQYAHEHVAVFDLPAPSGDRLSPPVWLAHFLLFFGAVTCVVLPNIMGVSDVALAVRQTVYTVYILLMLGVGLYCARGLAWGNLLYLLCAAGVALAALGTVLTTPLVRPLDYFGPASFLLGVHVFTNIVPRAFRGSAESIVLPVIVIVTTTVCVAFHFRFGVSVEHNNTVAAYAGLTTLLLVMRSLRRGTAPVVRFLCWSGVAVLLLVLATSFGRTSIIAFVGTGLILIWLASGFRVKLMIVLLLLLGLTLILGTEYGSSLFRIFLGKGLDWHKEQETLQSLSARTDIWLTGLSRGGWTWLGYGPDWIRQITGRGAHSSYFGVYFAHGALGLAFWLIMCGISLLAAIRTAHLHRGRHSYPLAPAMVLYFLVISVAESFFGLLINGFGILFFMGTGMCFLELRSASQRRRRAWQAHRGNQRMDIRVAHG
jgi:hypothetical protein